ncbi:MAG: SH3 domain-containing protein [Acidobacteriales bacterium]|nr:SH3 domain-containing protein [Terriglobales bacterium]
MRSLQPYIAGRLPALQGFATSPGADDRAWDRYQRGYYQCAVHVSPTAAGASLVRVSAKITAWYSDSVPSKSGYRVLPSNGRLETDLLDRLEEVIGARSATTETTAAVTSTPPLKSAHRGADPDAPSISAPVPRLPQSSKTPAYSTANRTEALQSQTTAAEKRVQALTAEARSLEEILNDQSHPANLAVVIKSGASILDAPRADAKVLFTASAEDEFEILDSTAEWVHLRISGLSRGWIRRSNVQMPDTAAAGSSQKALSAPAFHIASEQIAPFPGDWGPLRGKAVRIISVQKTEGDVRDSGPARKLEFAKSLFARQYADFADNPQAPAGIVLIFDSEDGGMVATTLPALQQWTAGKLSDDAFWRQCFFDPVELMDPAAK